MIIVRSASGIWLEKTSKRSRSPFSETASRSIAKHKLLAVEAVWWKELPPQPLLDSLLFR